MRIVTPKYGPNHIVYRDDQPRWMGEYFNPDTQVAVSIKYNVRFLRYGVHPASRLAILKRLRAEAKADPRSYPRRIMYGGPGSTEVVAIFDKVNLTSKEA